MLLLVFGGEDVGGNDMFLWVFVVGLRKFSWEPTENGVVFCYDSSANAFCLFEVHHIFWLP